MSLPPRWHDDVPADLRKVRELFGQAAFARVREIITALPGDPLLGDWLTDQADTGDLSTCRKVKLGPDEILSVGPRRDLIAYAVAAARLEGR